MVKDIETAKVLSEDTKNPRNSAGPGPGPGSTPDLAEPFDR